MSKESQVARSKQVGRGFWRRFNCLQCSPQARERSREDDFLDENITPEQRFERRPNTIGLPGSSRLMISGMVWKAKSCFGADDDSSDEGTDCCRRREPAGCNRESFTPWYQQFPEESEEIAKQPMQSSPGVQGRSRDSFPVSPIAPEGQEERFFTYPAYEAEDILPHLKRPQSRHSQSRKSRASDVFAGLADDYNPEQDYTKEERKSKWYRRKEGVAGSSDWNFYFTK